MRLPRILMDGEIDRAPRSTFFIADDHEVDRSAPNRAGWAHEARELGRAPNPLAMISSTADRREYRRRSCVHGTDAASAAECDSRARHDRGSRSPLASSVLRTFKVAGLGRARTTGTCNLAGGPRQDLVPESSGPPLNQPRQVHRRQLGRRPRLPAGQNVSSIIYC